MKVHFISVGGSVMHQLAIALKRKGYQVTGTDDEIFEPSKTNLQNEGLLPEAQGWNPALITADLDAVILGMHARDDNPEIVRAKELGLKIYSFPEYIFEESRDKIRVVVGGSHGKTTTTSMIMHVLKFAEKRFDYLVGARLDGFNQSVNITDAPVIVCEGDEYPASALQKKPKFHFLFPHIAILTGIAWDHINVFPTFDFYLEQFRIFIQKIETGGLLIYNDTDPVLKEVVKSVGRNDLRYQPYGIPTHDINEGKTTLTINGQSTGLMVFGNHNLMNIHAAWYACNELKVPVETFLEAVSDFTGASKRLEVLTQNEHTLVYRDFAHAPSKVKATMQAVKHQFPDRRLIAVLELHTFSSLNKEFMKEYAGALDLADEAVVFYSKHALEIKRMPDLASEDVQQGFNNNKLVIQTRTSDLLEWLSERNYSNANLLLMSSGNYDGLNLQQVAAFATSTKSASDSATIS